MSARAFDVLVIGSGAAGLTAALHLASTKKVGVIAKGPSIAVGLGLVVGTPAGTAMAAMGRAVAEFGLVLAVERPVGAGEFAEAMLPGDA